MGLITWHRWFRVTPCWLVTLLGSLPVANSDSVPAMAMRRTRPFVQCGLCLRLCTRQLGASLHTPPRLLAGDPPVASGFCSLLACFRSDECGDTITTYIYICVYAHKVGTAIPARVGPAMASAGLLSSHLSLSLSLWSRRLGGQYGSLVCNASTVCRAARCSAHVSRARMVGAHWSAWKQYAQL
jgi:hypothetical protein